MRLPKKILDFYLEGSIHVALAVFALVKLTQHMFFIEGRHEMPMFALFSTITGYNFVKYHSLTLSKPTCLTPMRKAIVLLSGFSAMAALYYFIHLDFHAQAVTLFFLALTVLYTLPFFPNRRNARNWAGIKIYIVALCWVGVTLVLPVLDAGIIPGNDFLIKCIQRFIFIFVLILVFEIVDLAVDDPHLRTLPQQIGVGKTKTIGLLLLVIFFAIEFFYGSLNTDVPVTGVIASVTAVLLMFSSPTRHRYYSGLMAEATPVLWWLLMCWFENF